MANADDWARRIGPSAARTRRFYQNMLWINAGWYLVLVSVVLVGRDLVAAPNRNTAGVVLLVLAVTSFLVLTLVTARASKRATRTSSFALTQANGREVRVPIRALQGTEWFDTWANRTNVNWATQ
jgi:hypothetical protein